MDCAAQLAIFNLLAKKSQVNFKKINLTLRWKKVTGTFEDNESYKCLVVYVISYHTVLKTSVSYCCFLYPIWSVLWCK